MPQVKFVTSNGEVHSVYGDSGASIMQVAMDNNIEGIEALCGGFCSCATCHVYVDPSWFGRLDAVSEQEDAMLDGTLAERKPESRLACQISLTEALDGITVTVPAS